MAMAGKTSLPHLFNYNKSSQMKVSKFNELANYIKDCDYIISDENFHISEKIDGSTTLIGFDDRFFVEKFGVNERLYSEDDVFNEKAKSFFRIFGTPEMKAFLKRIKEENRMDFVKVQFEAILSAFSRDPDFIRIILVPYRKDVFGKDGGAFVVKIIGDDLQPLPNQDGLKEEICSILNSDSFLVKPMSATTIEYEPFSVEDIVKPYIDHPTKETARITQEDLQNEFLKMIPESQYAEFYEGLVVVCKDVNIMFKMTSNEFKAAFQAHNEKKKEFRNQPRDILVGSEPGLNKISINGKDVLVGKISDETEIVGILFGHFAPFTGKYGHGRMIDAVRELGATKFVIGIPYSGSDFDDDRMMYSPKQRAEICNKYLEDENLEGDSIVVRQGTPTILVKELVWHAYHKFGPKIRPVIVVGPDREKMFEMHKDFGTDPDTTYPEKIVMRDRGEKEVSGTKVRELIRQGDIDGIMKYTGYSKEMAKYLIDMRNENKEKGFENF